MSPFSWDGQQEQEREKERERTQMSQTGVQESANTLCTRLVATWKLEPRPLTLQICCVQPIGSLNISSFKPENKRARSLLLKPKIATNKILTRTNLY